MKTGKINIGTWSKDDEMKVARKVSRELELENSTGWVSKHKIHKSAKCYTRKSKHKKDLAF
jgi:hypothetical protein